MDTASFYFHDELNDFLPPQRRAVPFTHTFSWRASVKDMVESLGVPHAEVELLTANQTAVGFDYIVQPNDAIDVYPRFERVDLPYKVRLRPPLTSKPSFVLDTHLGRSAAYLRMLGFDTLYRNDYDDEELADISWRENRVLLTRDLGLLKRSLVIYGYFVRHTNPKKRIAEIIQRFNLTLYQEPFKYCMKCNGLLHGVPKSAVMDRISETTARYHEEFHTCESCHQVYWRGSHYERMQIFMQEILTIPPSVGFLGLNP